MDFHTTMGLRGVVAAAAVALAVTGCGAGSSGGVLGVTGNNGNYRFLNASPDAGSVDVYVDGTKETTLAYGAFGPVSYVQFPQGNHTVSFDAAGTQTVVLSAQVGINTSQTKWVVLAGETHPATGAPTIGVLQFADSAYNTPGGGAGVNFHNAATANGTAATQFGWYNLAATGTNGPLGLPVPTGGNTQPQGLPAAALAPTTVGFYAGSPTAGGFTTTPSNIDAAGCSANTMPCNSGNLSLFLIDGPAATTAPNVGTLPSGITNSTRVGFVGIFEANGY